MFPPSKRPTNSVEQVGSDDDADDDDEDRDSIEFMLNNTVSKIQAVNQENEDGHDEEDSQHSVFNYALNESVIVEHILDSCRNFKRFGHTDLLTKSENKVGFYDFENCCTYRGNFFNDKPQGIGIIELRNGQVFFGHFIRGVKVDNKFH